jgi:hypothetical protein
MIQKISSLLLCSVFLGNAVIFAQVTDKKPLPKPADMIAELSSEMKEQVADYLQQNVSLSLSLNSDENRVSYLLKTANLLWEINKTQSRTVFRSSFEDIRKIVTEIDFEMTELEKMPDTEIAKASVKNKVLAKLRKLNVLTSAVTTQVSKTDPKIGYNFFQELKLSIKNEQLRKNFDVSISVLQNPLLDEIAEKSIDTALSVANKRLNEQGFFEDSIDLLLTVLKKEPKKANDFAKRILLSIKASRNARQYFSSLQRLLQIGNDNLKASQKNNSAQKPLFTSSELEKLSELIDSYLYNPELKFSKPTSEEIYVVNPRREASRAKLLDAIDKSVNAPRTEPKQLFKKEIEKLIKPIEDKNFPSAEKKRLIADAMRRISLV